MSFEEWFSKIQNSKSGGLLLLFNRLLREFETDNFADADFQGDLAFTVSESLKLPDLCGHAQWPQKSPSVRFKDWFTEYVVPYGTCFSSEELWKIRNDCIHGALVSNNYGLNYPCLGKCANWETMTVQRNLLNVCMLISRSALGFYLQNHEKFEALNKSYRANWRIYKSDTGLELVREFALCLFEKNLIFGES